MDLKFIVTELCMPVLISLGMLLAVPTIISRSIVPAFGMLIEQLIEQYQCVVARQKHSCMCRILLDHVMFNTGTLVC